MALTINNFWGAETGGFEEALSAASNVNVSSAVKHSGGYSYELTSNTIISTELALDPFDSVTDAGNDYIVGFWFYSTDVAPAGLVSIFEGRESVNIFFRLVLESDGDLAVWDANDSTIRTITTPFTASTWHFIEVYFQHSATGTIEVFIDGVSQGSDASQDLTDGGTFDEIVFGGDTDLDASFYVDDIYFMSGATAASDRLGDCEVFAYRSNLSSASGDKTTNDTALNVGTWATMQSLPFDASGNGYTAAAESYGGINTDDLGGSASTGGPNTDANVDGDSNIKAMKGVWVMQRSGGSAAAQYGLLSNSGSGDDAITDVIQSPDFDITTSPANYFFVTEDSTENGLPTSSEYGYIGIGKSSGGQDLDCSDMLFQILHVPSAAPAGPFPYETIETQQRRIARMFNF